LPIRDTLGFAPRLWKNTRRVISCPPAAAIHPFDFSNFDIILLDIISKIQNVIVFWAYSDDDDGGIIIKG
jgi:hypothetical protein